MTVERQQFHKRIKGALAETEDWWTLLTDRATGKKQVEHEWSHTDAYKGSGTDSGTQLYTVDEFMKSGPADAIKKLEEILAASG